jgi:Ice-binding-like/PEP-CTERM motif
MKSRAVRCLALSFLLLPLLILNAYAGSCAVTFTSSCLGSAGSYAVLAGSTVTNTGSSVLYGNVGVWAGSAVTGFPPGILVGGTIYAGNAVAQGAQSALTTAYIDAAGLAPTVTLTGISGSMTLTPGVYSISGAAALTGTLTLEGMPGSLFVFQSSALTTASGQGRFSVIFINSLTGKPMNDPNIFWQTSSSATLGTYTAFEGNILALTSITLDPYSNITCGSALARNGAVTLNGNTITGCGAGGARTTSTVPEPGTLGLLGTGLAILAGVGRRKLHRALI